MFRSAFSQRGTARGFPVGRRGVRHNDLPSQPVPGTTWVELSDLGSAQFLTSATPWLCPSVSSAPNQSPLPCAQESCCCHRPPRGGACLLPRQKPPDAETVPDVDAAPTAPDRDAGFGGEKPHRRREAWRPGHDVVRLPLNWKARLCPGRTWRRWWGSKAGSPQRLGLDWLHSTSGTLRGRWRGTRKSWGRRVRDAGPSLG